MTLKLKTSAFFVSVISLLLPSLALSQTLPTPVQSGTIQIKGAREDQMPVLKDRQLGASWRIGDPEGKYRYLWIGSASGVNMLLARPAPVSLPPNGPATGRLSGSFPSPLLANSGVTSARYGDLGHYPVFDVSMDGTLSYAGSLPLPVVPTIPGSLPPNGLASGDLSGSYPAPVLATITTAKTVGASTQIPVITTDAKGRVTSLTTVTVADPWTAQITALQAAMTAQQNRTQNKRAAVGAMLLGATQSIAITWATPFADTNYNVQVQFEGSTTLLSNVTVRGVPAKTTTGCTVLVQAGGVLVAGATIAVTAIHD